MDTSIKDIIKQEYIKCSQDPIYFMVKYCYIQHPDKGKLPFHLFPFQKKVQKLFEKHDYSIILKSRQLGISTLCAGYALHMMIFNESKNILCIATKQDTAKNMITKVKYMYDNLPNWLALGRPLEKSALTLKLKNDSQMKATPSSSDAGRSEAVSLLIIDEGAFIGNIDTIWGAAQQTLATGGKAIVLSTPNGKGNWFHRTWSKAQAQENGFLPIKLPWTVHPERNQPWRDEQDIILGDEDLAKQECDCSFLASGGNVFNNEYMEDHDKNIMTPIEKRGDAKEMWIFKRPDYTRTYMVVADVARGDAADYSAFHIMDIEANEQVAEFKGKIGTKNFGHLLVNVSTEYNNALLVIENANVGWNTLQVPIDLNYKNLFYSTKGGTFNLDKYSSGYQNQKEMVPGFTMSSKTRPMVIGKLRENFKDLGIIIHSQRTINESEVFIWKNGKAQAQHGFNDDLIMALGIGCFVRETAIKFKNLGQDESRMLLNHIKTNKHQYERDVVIPTQNSYNRHRNTHEAFIQHTKHGAIDFSWVSKK